MSRPAPLTAATLAQTGMELRLTARRGENVLVTVVIPVVVLLFFASVGKVQGFAFTLGLTTLIDVLVVFLFTKPLMTLLARTKFFGGGHPLSGLDPRHLGVPVLPGLCTC